MPVAPCRQSNGCQERNQHGRPRPPPGAQPWLPRAEDVMATASYDERNTFGESYSAGCAVDLRQLKDAWPAGDAPCVTALRQHPL